MTENLVEAAIEDARAFLAISYWPNRKRFVDPHDLASQTTADCLERGELPPDWARSLVIARLRRDVARGLSRNSGPDPLTNVPRDFYITLAVSNTCDEYGFLPMRNRATRDRGTRESGCSIVAAALLRLGVHLSEDAIEKIWKRLGPRMAS